MIQTLQLMVFSINITPSPHFVQAMVFFANQQKFQHIHIIGFCSVVQTANQQAAIDGIYRKSQPQTHVDDVRMAT